MREFDPVIIYGKSQAGVASGTCFFVFAGPDFAAAAIDTRKNTETGPDDAACKITCLDSFNIFLCQGVVEGWGSSASDIAKALFTQNYNHPHQLASAWSNEMCKNLGSLDRTNDFIRKSLQRGEAAGAIFLGHDKTGDLQVIQVQIKERMTSRLTGGRFKWPFSAYFVSSITRLPPNGYAFTGEYRPFIKELLDGSTDRAKKLKRSISPPRNDLAKFEAYVAAACVKAAIMWSGSNEIGGEISTIILRKGQGYEWIYKPSFC